MMTTSETPAGLSGAYRAVWRWHFYAGVLVLPFLMLMALTGGLYLFKTEIDGLVYGRMSLVEARAATTSPDRWIGSAEAGTGGKVANLIVPARSRRGRASDRRSAGRRQTHRLRRSP
jgi:uncharacterized iron-regulated membrane protein